MAAFLVLKTGKTFDIWTIRKHCLDNLASYKIPMQIIAVGALSKTASGKIINYYLSSRQRKSDEFEIKDCSGDIKI